MGTSLTLVCGFSRSLPRPVRVLAACLALGILAGAAPAQQTRTAHELTARQGLPHVVAKLLHGDPVTVAYLGGSITAQEDGWRSQTFAWLRSSFPHASLTEVDAAVSGTDSTLGAFRLRHDVLGKKPDLLLVEFSVNDAGGRLAQDALEGIVRQTWAANADTDICFIYTVNTSLLPALLNGEIAASSESAEKVAEHYGIPSINFGLTIAAAVRSKAMVMTGPRPVPGASADNGPVAFSEDGTHPYPETGHRLYLQAFVRSFVALEPLHPRQLDRQRAPLDEGNLDRARSLPVDAVEHAGDWHTVNLQDPTGQMQRSLPQVWAVAKPGASIDFAFDGNLFGIFGVKGPDAGDFTITIDHQRPLRTTLRDPYSTAGRYRIRCWFSPLLPPGRHTVHIETVAPAPGEADHSTLYVGQLLVNGSFEASRQP